MGNGTNRDPGNRMIRGKSWRLGTLQICVQTVSIDVSISQLWAPPLYLRPTKFGTSAPMESCTAQSTNGSDQLYVRVMRDPRLRLSSRK